MSLGLVSCMGFAYLGWVCVLGLLYLCIIHTWYYGAWKYLLVEHREIIETESRSSNLEFVDLKDRKYEWSLKNAYEFVGYIDIRRDCVYAL